MKRPRQCARCHRTFDAVLAGTWLRVEGWAIVRSTGGWNVRDQEPTGKALCPTCGKEQELGVMPGQVAMFDG